jgi:protein FrlC
MGTINLSQVAGMNEHYYMHTLDYFLDSMVELGIENIEFWAGSPHLYIEDTSLSRIQRIRKEIEKRDLRLICYTPEQCIYPVNIAAKEPDIRQKSMAYFRNSLEAAAELGARMFQIVPGWGYYDEPTESAWTRSRDALAILSSQAASLGILMTLEPLEAHGTNIVRNSADLRRMLDEVGAPNLKGIIDTCPMHAAGEDFSDCFETLGADLKHVHFVDSGHCAWGEGDFPLEKYLSQLARHDYQGYLTIEICNRRYFTDPKRGDAISLQALRSVLPYASEEETT